MASIRGETVGAAYLRILADTSQLDRSIREGFDAGEAGEKDGEEFGERMKKAVSKEEIAEHIANEMRDKKKLQAKANEISDDLINELRKDFSDGRLGDLIGENVKKAFDKDAQGSVRDFYNVVVKAEKDANIQIGQEQAAATKKTVDEWLSRRQASKEYYDGQIKLQDENEKAVEAGQERLTKFIEESTKRQADIEVTSWLRRREAANNFYEDALKNQKQQDNLFESFRNELEKYTERELSVLNTRYRNIKNVNDKISSLFGRGSRNNFLNLIGSGVKGVLDGLTGIAKGFNEIYEKAKLAETPIKSLGAVMSGGAGLFSKAAGGAYIFATALGALLVIAGPVASLLVGIVAALTALASTISFAVIGGLGAAVPIFAALAVAVGTLFLAFKDNKKNLTDTLKPLKDIFDEVRAAVQERIFKGVTDAMAILTSPQGVRNVQALGQGFITMADALADVARYMAAAFTTPAIQQALDKFSDPTTGLPGIMSNLGRAFSDFAAGFTILTSVLLPFGERLSGVFADVALKFREWISTAEGQNKVAGFMDDAFESAKTLWRFLQTLGEAIGRVLFSKEGRESGNTLFDDMTTKLQEFLRQLDSKKLKEFFDQGVEVARELGTLILRIVDFVNKLNTKEAQEDLKKFFDILGTVFNIIDKLARIAIPLFEFQLWLLLGPLMAIIKLIKGDWQGALEDLIKPFKLAWEFIKALFDAAGIDIEKWVTETLPKALSTVWDTLSKPFVEAWDWIYQKGSTVLQWFEDLPGNIDKAISTLTGIITQPFIDAFNSAVALGWNVIQWFIELPGHIFSALLSLASTIAQPFIDAYNIVAEWVGKIKDFFINLPGDIAAAVLGVAAAIAKPFEDAYAKVAEWVNKIKAKASEIKNAVLGITSASDLFDIDSINQQRAAAGLPPIESKRKGGNLNDGWTWVGEDGPELALKTGGSVKIIDNRTATKMATPPAPRPGYGAPAPTAPQTNVNHHWTINSPAADPEAVAQSMMNKLVAAGR